MQKRMKKFVKLLLLIAVIFSDLMTPISVLAEEIASEVNKGDIRLNGEVSSTGSATVSTGSLTNDGDVLATKTVSKTDTEGRYKVEFNIKGKDVVSNTSVTKPLYVVIVFDRSGSMENTCIKSHWGYCTEYDNKWDNAVQGARNFANILLEKIDTSQIALVTFSKTSSVSRNFSNSNLDNVSFGTANGGTNLHAGLIEANNLLSSSEIPSDAYKYVVIMSDGEPTYYINSNGGVSGSGSRTNKNILDATFKEADSIKSSAEVFSIGYMLPTEPVYSDGVYGSLTAKDILEKVASEDTDKDKENGIAHYIEANPEKVAISFNNIANQISRSKAGTNAILTDNIGNAFKIVSQDGSSYVSDVIPEITEEGTTLSFYIDIDKDSPTGWYNTNAGFNLKYTDAQGVERIISSDENPEVYWIQNKYNYVVNYYKDSFDGTNLIASETREAVNGTVINESNVLKDKYSPIGYEFNSLSPESITVTNNGSTKVINVLYTKKKFDYVVNYYYDGVLDTTTTISDVQYGTNIDSTTYYLQDSEIKEGYSLDTINSDNASYTITDNSVVIDIYYKKNSYSYTVKYHFNNNIDTDFTKNSNALYGTTIKASDNYLSDAEKGEIYKDYFLDPMLPANTETKVIGTGTNELNLYYINTISVDEVTSKTTSVNKITSSNDVVDYKVTYSSTTLNVRKGDTVTVTITDTLPYEIDLSTDNTNLNGGTYDSLTKTITWIYEETAEEFTREYNIFKEVNYTVVYKDFAGLSSEANNKLVNSAKGTTTVAGKTTTGSEDHADIPVEISGTLTVNYKDLEGNTLSNSVSKEGLVGSFYQTEQKAIYGYTFNHTEGDATTGKYIDGSLNVTYYYTKNSGEVTENKVVKEGPVTVTGINDTFNYKLTYKGEIDSYKGTATLKLIDILPYEINEEKSNLDNRCIYNRETKEIVCTENYTLDENVKSINEEFNLSLVFINIDNDIVTNNVKSELNFDKSKATNEDKTETKVEKGVVVATYKDTEGNTLHDNVTTAGLSGNGYATEEKVFYGYTLKEVPSNKEGKYEANETIIVNYVYSKNNGTSKDELSKNGNTIVETVDSKFDYTITYNTTITDYVGEVKLVITDILPYKIDEEKSIFSENCKYIDGKLICTYDNIVIDEENRNINIEENFSLYYIGVDSNRVLNRVESVLEHGEIIKKNNDEFETKVEEGKVTVNYVTKVNGEYVKLTDSLELNGLVGQSYTTLQKEFDKYSFAYVIGNKEGEYSLENTEVTYVYNLTEIPLPPQTGLESNFIPFGYALSVLLLFILRKTYKTLKSN